MKTITQSQNGSSIKVSKGDHLQLKLDENATTGYRWKLNSYNKDHFSILEKEGPTNDEGIGAAHVKIYDITILAEGSAELSLSLQNQWEHDTSETFTVHFKS